MAYGARHAEALAYTPGNPYLSLKEKFEVECWFLLPGAVGVSVFLALAVAAVHRSVPIIVLAGLPLLINGIIGLLDWTFYRRGLVVGLGLVFHPWAVNIVGLVTAGYLFYSGHYGLGTVALLSPFHLFSPLYPHVWMYSFLSRPYEMHPKYAFFKRFYGKVFPFEYPSPEEQVTGRL